MVVVGKAGIWVETVVASVVEDTVAVAVGEVAQETVSVVSMV